MEVVQTMRLLSELIYSSNMVVIVLQLSDLHS